MLSHPQRENPNSKQADILLAKHDNTACEDYRLNHGGFYTVSPTQHAKTQYIAGISLAKLSAARRLSYATSTVLNASSHMFIQS
ncbi:hypothetical protein ACUHMQ_07420 [Chitinimonas sp. PSY-7]|uniref:hypothetical protein n=1 Tax=Chitinimonas sp. PSY-7 TaxID=3459088 RepID=UPI0040403342